jgi:hypothetical protein
VVGNPARLLLDPLAARRLDEPTFDAIVARVRALGFDGERLRRTVQPG